MWYSTKPECSARVNKPTKIIESSEPFIRSFLKNSKTQRLSILSTPEALDLTRRRSSRYAWSGRRLVVLTVTGFEV